MAQDLTVNIKTTSDVPAAMDRAKTATVGFGKQVDDIQKKFSMAFKDVFLSFLGPLALLGVAMNYIGKLIDDNRKKHEDANQAAIDSTNALMSAEDKYWANKRNNEKKGKETLAEAKTTREDTTEQFINEDIRGKKIARRLLNKIPGEAIMGYEAKSLSKSPAVQAEVQALIAEDIKNNPAAGANLKDTNFKGPEGFSNVVGVGANPVMEAMAEQTELARQQLVELQKLNAKDTGTPTDFTKNSK
jgi:hypothetical protein